MEKKWRNNNGREGKAKKINRGLWSTYTFNDDDEDYVLGSNSSSKNYEQDKHDKFAIINDLWVTEKKER